MATRFTAESVGILGTSYTLYIDDSAFGGSNTDIEITGFVINYDPTEQDDPSSPILSSSCTFTVNVLSSYQSAFNTFIDDLIAADEGRFMVKIENNVGNLYWVGFMVTDQIIKEDQDYADIVSSFVVSAVDGISRLKDIDYNNAGDPYTGRETIHDHLFNLFDKMGTSDIWDTLDPFLYVSSRWYETGMGAAATDNPLELTFIDHESLYKVDENGGYEYESCYDVLKYICRLFFSRFYLSSGVYRIDQISEYIESTVTLHRYYKSGTKSASSTGQTLERIEGTPSGTFLRRGGVGGKYMYFAPVRRITMAFSHRSNKNYLPGESWTSNADPAVTTAEIGLDGVRLIFSGRAGIRADFTPTSDFRPGIGLFSIQLKASAGGTDYYLKRSYTLNTTNGYTYDAAEWTTNVNDLFYFFGANVTQVFVFVYENISFETPELPTTGVLSTVSVDVTFEDYYKFVNNSIPVTLSPTSTTWSFNNSGLHLNADDDSALTEETIYELDNADTPNASLVIEYETPFADTAATVFLSTNVLTVDTGAGTPGAISTAWAKGTGGGGDRIQELFLEEQMKLRKTTLERYEGTILGKGYFAHNTMELNTGSKYALLRAEYNSYTEEWAGEWFFIEWTDTQGSTPTDPVHVQPEIPRIGAGPLYPSAAPGGGGGAAQAITSGGGHVVATTDGQLAPNGAITQIDIDPICTGIDDLILAGDTISVYDPITGNVQDFTVDANVSGSDTNIRISSSTINSILSDGALVLLDSCSFISNVQAAGQPVRYRQIFTSTGSPTLTVTLNGGVLPSDNNNIDVFYGATPIFETDDWSVSGSDIILAWNPEVGVKIRVFFWI